MDDGERVTVTHEEDVSGRAMFRDKINGRWSSKVGEGGRALVGLLDQAVAYEGVVQAHSTSTQRLLAGAMNSRMFSLLKSNINDLVVVF